MEEDHSATHSEGGVSLRAGEGPSTKQGLLLQNEVLPPTQMQFWVQGRGTLHNTAKWRLVGGRLVTSSINQNSLLLPPP